MEMTRRNFIRVAAGSAVVIAGSLLGYHTISSQNNFEMRVPEEKMYVIQVHDVSVPFFKKGYLHRTVDAIEKADVEKVEYYIIPSHQEDPYIMQHNPNFSDFVKERLLSQKIGQHGLTHWPEYSEYGSLDYQQVSERNKKGIEIMQKELGIRPDRFIFPFYSYNDESERAAIDLFSYLSHDNRVLHLDRGVLKVIDARYLNPTWEPRSSTDKIIRSLDKEMQNENTLMLGVHVQDSRFDQFENILSRAIKLIEENGYKPITSDELFF